MSPGVYIHAIRTAVPAAKIAQEDILSYMRKARGLAPGQSSLLDSLYSHSAIEYRHSVLGDFASDGGRGTEEAPVDEPSVHWSLFKGGENPGTGARNQVFSEAAEQGSVALAKSFLKAPRELEPDSSISPGFLAGPSAGELSHYFDSSQISHLITVSCTGFSAPGFEIKVQEELGLRYDLERVHIGFMGCYASFPAMRMAASIIKAKPKAKVMILAAEFCTVHFQDDGERDTQVANSLFADGLGAMILSADPTDSKGPLFRLEGLSSRLLGGGQKMMAWTIGDTGFKMRLSAYVPRAIEANIDGIIDSLCAELGVKRAEIAHWAIHPGGRAILDQIAQGLRLPKRRFSQSYEILRRYGNMSSVTIMFVLSQIVRNQVLGKDRSSGKKVYAAAFGPGLTVESALLSFMARGESRDEDIRRFGAHAMKLPLFFPRLSRRAQLSELMDDPEVELEALYRTFAQFDRINRMLTSYRPLLRSMIFRKESRREFTLVDLGCGGGDVLRWVAERSRKLGFRARLVGIDPDPRAVAYATKACEAFPEISIRQASFRDLSQIREELGEIAYIISNHVMHHLNSRDLRDFIRIASEHAASGLLLNDLRRSRLAYLAYGIYAAIFARKSLAAYDGKLSIMRGFKREELEELCRLPDGRLPLRVRRKALFRLLITAA